MSFCAIKLSGGAGLGPEQTHKKFSTRINTSVLCQAGVG